MKKGFKIFLASFILSLPFWWGINNLANNLEDFLFWQKTLKSPQIFTAQIDQKLVEEKGRQVQLENLDIGTKAAISVEVDETGKENILFEKNAQELLPIASVSKLMTANVVLEYFDLSKLVQISKEAIAQKEDFGKLKIGEVFRIENLLYPLLMESSNDAAFSLAEVIGQDSFVDLMNLEAEYLGLENTHFFNPMGIDPGDLQSINYSTAEDLVKLTKYLLEKRPLIWKILNFREFRLYSPDGVFHHKLSNTNELLGEIPEVIGGKTGETPRAGGCLLLVLKTPQSSYLINVILGSKDRFGEMQKLIGAVYPEL